MGLILALAVALPPETVAQDGAPDLLADPAYRSAVAAVEAAADRAELALAINALGIIHWSAARYDSSLHHLHRAVELWTELGDLTGLGRGYNNIGAAHYQWGNYEPALDAFLRSRAYRREVGDLRGQSLVLANIGRTYHDWQQYDRALAALQESVELGDESGDPFVAGYARHNLGVHYVALDSLDRAEALFLEALDLGSELGEADRASGWALNGLQLGVVRVRRGEVGEGIAMMEEVLAAAEEDSHPRRQARALVNLGEAYLAAGEPGRAVRTLERALAISTGAGQRPLVLEAHAGLAAAHESRGDHESALTHLRAQNALRDSIFNQTGAQRIAAMEARAEVERQERETARRDAVIARQRAIVSLGGALLFVSLLLVTALIKLNRTERQRRELLARTNAALASANQDLRLALSEVRTLKGLIPICSHCKKVRDDRGFWEAVETYISDRSDALFSHAICTECGPRIYGEDWVQPPGEPAPTD